LVGDRPLSARLSSLLLLLLLLLLFSDQSSEKKTNLFSSDVIYAGVSRPTRAEASSSYAVSGVRRRCCSRCRRRRERSNDRLIRAPIVANATEGKGNLS
jgi:hypothetical protein